MTTLTQPALHHPSTVPSTSTAISSRASYHRLLRLRLAASSTMPKMLAQFVLHSSKWATPNHPPQSKLITSVPKALPMTLSNSDAPRPLTCATTGSVTESSKTSSESTGAKALITSRTTSPSTTHPNTIASCAPNTYKQNHRPVQTLPLIPVRVY